MRFDSLELLLDELEEVLLGLLEVVGLLRCTRGKDVGRAGKYDLCIEREEISLKEKVRRDQ